MLNDVLLRLCIKTAFSFHSTHEMVFVIDIRIILTLINLTVFRKDTFHMFRVSISMNGVITFLNYEHMHEKYKRKSCMLIRCSPK